ncbi:glycoside hydrolase family 95 protein [Panaeolus papilionaceus]|nr:glycoside hydrolase family 95 protein [Panaeolus papilionaceus]
MRTLYDTLLFLGLIFSVSPTASSAPHGFPTSGNGLWYTQPGKVWSRELLPIGNGYLAAMVPGWPSQEVTQLNIESLWSGGPFTDPSYNGGNKQPSERETIAKDLQRIRQTIFQSPTGDISDIIDLTTDAGQYGSYAGAGHLISTFRVNGSISNYGRWLDMDQGVARTSWTQGGVDFERTSFCSHPTKACVEHTTSKARSLPDVTYAFTNAFEDGLPAPNVTCHSKDTLLVSGYAPGGPPAMSYAFLIRGFSSSKQSSFQCVQFPVPFGAPFNATLTLPASADNTEVWVTWRGETDYDMNAGDVAHGFSFRSTESPVSKLTKSPSPASFLNYQALLDEHVNDLKATLSSPFSLNLGQTPDLDTPTDVLKKNYKIDGPQSNAYLDWLLFNYGRYMLWASARGVLPANLQGKWLDGAGGAWSSDYHANINVQMNYWAAEITGLSSLTPPLFEYMEKTWAPRGQQTAEVLYNITRGWVTHNEMNIFGHTGMKAYGNSAQWADYPEANVWMMFHVWDHFDHTNDVQWWKETGYPLVKGVASFHLDKLMPDLHFNDSTLVVNPCNSPEQAPITFGCAHAQQLIWQLFNTIEKGAVIAGDNDSAFIREVRDKRARMDKGIKVGSWGQLQEWKVEKDSPSDTHRHLSHLIGLYPGYAIAGFDPNLQGTGPAKGLSRDQVLAAASVSLDHRGNGTGPDANAGWEKAWRAAAWAQLGNKERFYHELSFAISENFGANLFSLYNPYEPVPIFQIDANFGYPAAVMNGLIHAPDVPTLSTPLTITVLPALPNQWSNGSVKGARIRGGLSVSFEWKNSVLVHLTIQVDRTKELIPRPVSLIYGGRVVDSFRTSVGLQKSYNRF